MLSAFFIYRIAKNLKIDTEIAFLIILIFLYHPVFSFMIENAWPESVVTFFIISAVYFMNPAKKTWVWSVFLGAVLAIKSVYFLPLLTFLLSTNTKAKNIFIMMAFPIVLSLPFFYANPQLFLERTQIYVTHPEKIANVLAPTNISLSLSAVVLKYTGLVIPSIIAAIPAFAVAIFCLLKKPKFFAFSLISAYLVFVSLFMFGPYAFLYNFVMLGNILLLSILFLIPQKRY